MWSNSRRGVSTKLPPNRPRLRRISPLASMAASACRSVILLTPSAPAISTSDGSLSPGANRPETISFSSQTAIREWAGCSDGPPRSGRSASTASSIDSTRIPTTLPPLEARNDRSAPYAGVGVGFWDNWRR